MILIRVESILDKESRRWVVVVGYWTEKGIMEFCSHCIKKELSKWRFFAELSMRFYAEEQIKKILKGDAEYVKPEGQVVSATTH